MRDGDGGLLVAPVRHDAPVARGEGARGRAHAYETGFQDFRSGYAAAIGWSLFVIILGVTAVQMRLLRRYGADE